MAREVTKRQACVCTLSIGGRQFNWLFCRLNHGLNHFTVLGDDLGHDLGHDLGGKITN